MVQGKVVRELQGLERALLRTPFEDTRRGSILHNIHPFRTKHTKLKLPLKIQPEGPEDDNLEVIDLGAPKFIRLLNSQNTPARRYRYTPNPRLYPGPSRSNIKHVNNNSAGPQRGRRHNKRVFRRPVPNSRLYRPAQPRAPPPPASPTGPWPPPPAPANVLETASHAALRLSERRVWRGSTRSPALSPVRGKLSTGLQRPAFRSKPAKGISSSPYRRTARSRAKSPHRAPTQSTIKAPKTKRQKSKVSSPISSPDPRRLVVKLPAAGDARHTFPDLAAPRHTSTDLAAPRLTSPERAAPRYRPASEHFRARTLEVDSGTSSPAACVPATWVTGTMDAPQHSFSAEECSDGNESAPSEFLAEFLSAIMRRQYAEALKYCRLILQYEPNNATARGFCPLLQEKLAQQSPPARPAAAQVARAARSPRPARVRLTDSLDVSSGSSGEENALDVSPSTPHEVMEQEADSVASCSGSWSPCEAGAGLAPPGGPRRSASSGSVASQSSLELDSSEAPVRSSPETSLELSRRTDRTDSASASGSGAGWESSASAPPSSTWDDNGNRAPRAPDDADTCGCDAENNAKSPPLSPRASSFAARALVLKSEDSSASLRRLRAQYTCSIK